MRRGFGVILTLLTGGWLCSQDAGKLEIRGTVSEIGMSAGISGAQIIIYQFSINSERSVFAKGVTDSQGYFEFHPDHPDRYYIEASKPGYVADSADAPTTETLRNLAAGQPVEATLATGTLVTLDKDRPRQFLRFGLMRPAELRGRVIDDNDKPLAMFLVEALDSVATGTEPGPPQAGRAAVRTRQDGSFTIGALRPGSYLVRVSPPGKLVFKQPAIKFSEEDQSAVDEEFATAYWPGSRDAAGAGTVNLIPGTPMDLGAIHITRAQVYRARVSVRGCEPGDSIRYALTRQDPGEGPPIPLSLPGCDDFLVRGLAPGSWELSVQTKEKWAVVPLEITNRSVSVPVELVPDGQVSGEIVAAYEGMSLDTRYPFSVQLTQTDMFLYRDHMMAIGPAPKGRFVLRNVRGPRHTVQVAGIGGQYYVKEIRVDGVAASGSAVSLGLASRMEIVLDDQPAALTGMVTDGHEKVAEPRIYIEQWPFAPSVLAGARRPQAVAGDADGVFRIAGLTPGQYRVLAMPRGPIPDGANEWKISARTWDLAETVTLERGKSSEVRLKLLDPLR